MFCVQYTCDDTVNPEFGPRKAWLSDGDFGLVGCYTFLPGRVLVCDSVEGILAEFNDFYSRTCRSKGNPRDPVVVEVEPKMVQQGWKVVERGYQDKF